MTVTINNVNDDMFYALKNFISSWQGVEIHPQKNTPKDIQDKLDTAHKLFGMASEDDAEFIRNNRVHFSDRFHGEEN